MRRGVRERDHNLCANLEVALKFSGSWTLVACVILLYAIGKR